jgi:hypothetical protein
MFSTGQDVVKKSAGPEFDRAPLIAPYKRLGYERQP